MLRKSDAAKLRVTRSLQGFPAGARPASGTVP